MELKKIETATSLRVLPTGHVAHKLTEFAPGGWNAPTREQTKLFQAHKGDFRPVVLPGESRQRRQYQIADFPSGLAHTVLTRSHLSLCRNIYASDCRTDHHTTTDYPSGDVLIQEPSTFECSFASRSDVDANSTMGKSSAESRGPVAKTCPAIPCSTLAERPGKPSWTCGSKRLPASRKQSAHIHQNSWFVEPIISGNQWTYATGNAGDVAQSSIIPPQLRQVHREKQRPTRIHERRTALVSVRGQFKL